MAELSTKDSEGRPSTRKAKVQKIEGSEFSADDPSAHSTPRSLSRERVTPSEQSTSLAARVSLPDSTPADRMLPSVSSKSTSANASPQPTASHLAGSATTGASPYGTRSRNRATNSRPNYAEDKDTEMEFEYTAGKLAQNSTTPASQPMQRKISSGSYGRKSTVNNHNTAKAAAGVPPSAAPKEPIPGTSSFSVNDQQSKKRKAPGTSAAAVQTSTPSQQPPSSSTRKSTRPTNPTSSALRNNNVVTFESSGAYLSHGCLVADDKTKYKVNGELATNSYLSC